MVLTEVASGLEQPLFVTQAPGERERLYVVEQTGRIRVVEGGRMRAEPFLDLSGIVSCCGERGLLGLAFHPGYATNGRFFVNYTNPDGDTEIVEFRRASEDPPVADPEPARLFFRVDQPFPNHNGGMLAFAPDGTLAIGLGDGGGAGDPMNNARNPSSKLGKLLRIDVDRYPDPPAGNAATGDPDVWQQGLRNPWRFSFDRATGDLWIGDVGQDRFEEIDHVPAGQGGLDFGWPVTEGLHCFRPESGCDTTGLTLPVHEYDRSSGCSVTGGFVYRGAAIPELAGRYLFGDYCSNRMWLLTSSGGAPGSAVDVVDVTGALDPAGRVEGLSSFGEDLDGELYVVGLTSGNVFRVDAAGGAP